MAFNGILYVVDTENSIAWSSRPFIQQLLSTYSVPDTEAIMMNNRDILGGFDLMGEPKSRQATPHVVSILIHWLGP